MTYLVRPSVNTLNVLLSITVRELTLLYKKKSSQNFKGKKKEKTISKEKEEVVKT